MPNLISLRSDAIVPNLFSLKVRYLQKSTELTMQLHIPTVNTCDLPRTYATLHKHLPSILRSQCFNEENLPFMTEVRKTEIGHLFEHILLEYLCLIKIASGCKKASYSGRTYWNWQKETPGIFHITIDAHKKDRVFLELALKKTIQLTKLLILHPTHKPNLNAVYMHLLPQDTYRKTL